MQTIETKWKENLNFAGLLYTPSVCSGSRYLSLLKTSPSARVFLLFDGMFFAQVT